jgi:hypothetical protein
MAQRNQIDGVATSHNVGRVDHAGLEHLHVIAALGIKAD